MDRWPSQANCLHLTIALDLSALEASIAAAAAVVAVAVVRSLGYLLEWKLRIGRTGQCRRPLALASADRPAIGADIDAGRHHWQDPCRLYASSNWLGVALDGWRQDVHAAAVVAARANGHKLAIGHLWRRPSLSHTGPSQLKLVVAVVDRIDLLSKAEPLSCRLLLCIDLTLLADLAACFFELQLASGPVRPASLSSSRARRLSATPFLLSLSS